MSANVGMQEGGKVNPLPGPSAEEAPGRIYTRDRYVGRARVDGSSAYLSALLSSRLRFKQARDTAGLAVFLVPRDRLDLPACRQRRSRVPGAAR